MHQQLQRLTIIGTLLLAAHAAGAAGLAASASDYLRHAEQEPAARLVERYRTELEPALGQDCPDACLRAAFEAVSTALFYGNGVLPADGARLLYSRLERRGLADAALAREMHENLIRARDFEGAAKLRRERGLAGMEAPRLRRAKRGAPGRRLLAVAGGSTLEESFHDLSSQRLVVLMRPDCHFTADAFAAIEADEALSAELAGRTLLLMAPSGEIGFERVRKWNRDHPRFPARLVDSTSDWPEIREWDSVPIFYRVADGRLAESEAGWKDSSRLELLRSWLPKK